jgi:MFS transporter, FHS family, L-fucose permease
MRRNHLIVALVFLVFFVISLITNILGPLIPEMIQTFGISLALAGFIPFSFFLAYGVMSIPAGLMMERYREKAVIAAAFAVACAGSLAFALLPVFRVGLASLFLIGLGMAALQVAINPLLRVAGGEQHFAFNSVLAQLIFGLASFISPQIYAYFVGELSLPWISLYWLFAAVTLLMIVVVLVAPLPRVTLKEDERAGGWDTHRALLQRRYVWLYAIGIFCYVGFEQGVANWISQFLQTYHGFDPRTVGANAVSGFWGFLTAGCVLGLVLLKLLDSRYVLIAAAAGAMIALAAALFGPARVALLAFPLVGFCASVMWSIIFALALNSATEHHGSFSGILCTAIVGGAVVPLLIGWQGDLIGLRQGMLLLYLPLGYIAAIGFWARPLVNNATLRRKKHTQTVSS